MTIYTSYFYQIRFFQPNMLPISTAKWDPKWFHDFKGQGHVWVDKNGVTNGLRAEPFVPGPACCNLCSGFNNCDDEPKNCNFLKCYETQLMALPFEAMLKRLNDLGDRVRKFSGFMGPPIYVFIVHESVNNPCSERRAIQKYFNRNYVVCKELDPKDFFPIPQ